MNYPRVIVDQTHAPHSPVAGRIVAAINYAAAYEDIGLHDANDAIIEYWHTLTPESIDNDQDVIVDRITDILSDHGYTLDVAPDHPGLWVLDISDAL